MVAPTAVRMLMASRASAQKMRYPYTLGAQVMQFPYKFHYENCWYTRAMVPGFIFASIFAGFFQYKTNGNKMHSWD